MTARSRREEQAKGQAIVEFAFVLVAFVMLTMGIVDLGRAVFFHNMLANAAREGAREGIISSNTVDQMCAAALAQVLAPGVDTTADCSTADGAGGTSAGTLTIYVTRGTAPSGGSPGTPDTVKLDYTFTPITPIISAVAGSSITLEASSSMFLEP